MKNPILAAVITLIATAGLSHAKESGLQCDSGGKVADLVEPQLTAQLAEAVIKNFEANALKNAKQINEVPVEFAGALLVLPYASEHLTPFKNPNRTDVCVLLREKNAFWTVVKTTLLDAKRTAPKAEATENAAPDDTALNSVSSDIRAIQNLTRSLQEARAILDDIAADDAIIASPDPVFGQALLTRKEALFSKSAKTNASNTVTDK